MSPYQMKHVGENKEAHTLGNRIYHKIREDILNGIYEPDEELRENTLGKELGVSRTPVREALRQLELEGLVYIIPNKGAYVKGISHEDIRDIYMIRSRLEGLSARLATEKITEEQLEALEEVIYLSEFHARKGHYEKVFEMDSKFHKMLYEASGSKQLNHILTDYHHYVQRARKRSVSENVRAGKSTEEHRRILEAIRDRDPERAEELAKEHIVNAIHNMHITGIEMEEEDS